MKLLCLSSDNALSTEISNHSQRMNWSAVVLRDRQGIREAVNEHHPDILLVEVDDLADLNWWKGTSLDSTAPVIFLNNEMTPEFLATALDSGADGFLPKSLFSVHLFEARIRASLRRFGIQNAKRLVSRLDLTIDNEHYTIEVKGQPLSLTLTEFKILRQLCSEVPRVVPRQEIQNQVFGQTKLSTRSLDVHVCSLRKKVKAVGLAIESVRGVGYRLNPARR